MKEVMKLSGNKKDQLSFRVPAGLNQKLKDEANRIGVSQNAYILMLIDIAFRATISLGEDE